MKEFVFLILLPIVICIAIFMLFRAIFLWYWRINEIVSNQERIIALLERKEGISTKKKEDDQPTTEENLEPFQPFSVGQHVSYFGKEVVVSAVNDDGTIDIELTNGTPYLKQMPSVRFKPME